MFKAIGRVFKKVGKKLAKGATDPRAVAAIKLVSVHVPVVGPALAIALAAVSKAEELFKELPKSGDKKRPWAISETRNELRKLGLEEKRIRALVELALLLFKEEANLVGKKKPHKPREKPEDKEE